MLTEREGVWRVLTMTATAQGGDKVGERRSSWRGRQVCSLAGITYRQLDYWARTGVVVPSVADARGSGTQRLYSTVDVAACAVLRLLASYGCRLSVMSDLVRSLQGRELDSWPAMLVVAGDGCATFCDDPSSILDALAGCDAAAAWVVDLRRVIDDVDDRAAALR